MPPIANHEPTLDGAVGMNNHRHQNNDNKQQQRSTPFAGLVPPPITLPSMPRKLDHESFQRTVLSQIDTFIFDADGWFLGVFGREFYNEKIFFPIFSCTNMEKSHFSLFSFFRLFKNNFLKKNIFFFQCAIFSFFSLSPNPFRCALAG